MTAPEDIVRTPTQLSHLLRSARLAAGLTQAQLAKQLGITTQAMSQLEGAPERASFARIHRLCNALGLEMSIARGQPELPSTVDW